MPKGEIVGKCLIGSICLSLMASTTVKMAGSEGAPMETQEQCKLGGEASVIVASHPEFPMTVKSQCRQEEHADMEDRSRALDPRVRPPLDRGEPARSLKCKE
jgi:hypothetical protein